MIYLILIFVYCCLMLLGSVTSLVKNHKQLDSGKKMALYFYTVVHLLFLSLAVVEVSGYDLGIFPYLVVIVFVLLSRFINGRVLFNKNHWHHYIVFGSLFVLILILKIFDI